MNKTQNRNLDAKTVAGFGDEWDRFDQSELSEKEHLELFEKYFNIFPWQNLPLNAQGFDMGCGSGRWAKLVASRVGKLHCIDPSSAIQVAKRNLAAQKNCLFYKAGVGDQVLPEASMDFGYSLGVLHHVPDTAEGIRDCVRMLKPGAPFLLYLYYAMDNRSFNYRLLWFLSNLLRSIISKMPHAFRYTFSQFIALFIYWPLARFAALMETLGMSSARACALPLGFYRDLSFYTMRTDALDRFGTRLEQRFTRKQIQSMMESAGLTDIRFSEGAPYWCAVGIKSRSCVA
jgi:ubiquinone/menaquinone biosynthesis C-methylase UbiE